MQTRRVRLSLDELEFIEAKSNDSNSGDVAKDWMILHLNKKIKTALGKVRR